MSVSGSASKRYLFTSSFENKVNIKSLSSDEMFFKNNLFVSNSLKYIIILHRYMFMDSRTSISYIKHNLPYSTNLCQSFSNQFRLLVA